MTTCPNCGFEVQCGHTNGGCVLGIGTLVGFLVASFLFLIALLIQTNA